LRCNRRFVRMCESHNPGSTMVSDGSVCSECYARSEGRLLKGTAQIDWR
jgi:hypothetical protein